MKFVYPDINEVFVLNQPYVNTLIIENQQLLRKLLRDIFLSIDGISTPVVLSKNNTPIDFSKNAEVILDFINFNINRKSLLNKICTSLEHNALSPENYLETQKLLSYIENRINGWAFDFPCDIFASKISVSNLLKSVGIEINNDYDGEIGDAERIVDYMELVREFDCDKLFITVNMRSYFSDNAINTFMKTVVSHEYHLLMIESKSHTILKNEKRLTIDTDLCEF